MQTTAEAVDLELVYTDNKFRCYCCRPRRLCKNDNLLRHKKISHLKISLHERKKTMDKHHEDHKVLYAAYYGQET